MPGLSFVRGAIRAMAREVGADASPLLATVSGPPAIDALAGLLKPTAAEPVAIAGAFGGFNPARNRAGLSLRGLVMPAVAVVGAGLLAIMFGGNADSSDADGARQSKVIQVPVPGSNRIVIAPGPQAGPRALDVTSAVRPAMRPAIRTNVQPVAINAGFSPPASGQPEPKSAGVTSLAVRAGQEDKPILVFPVKPAGPEPVELSFSKPTWIEIRHKNGEKLLFGTQKRARSMTIQGVPPMKVVIGNPDGVKMRFRGEAVDLRTKSRKGVSRFILN